MSNSGNKGEKMIETFIVGFLVGAFMCVLVNYYISRRGF